MHLARFKPAFPLKVLFLLLVVFTSLATGNTEIRNFAVSRHGHGHGPQDSSLGSTVSTCSLVKSHLHTELHNLNATHKEQSFRVVPAPLGTPLQSVCENSKTGEEFVEGPGCPHELWLEIDLSSEEWIRYEKFTIRLSWPAFYPTDFDIELFSPDELAEYIHSRSRLRERKPEKDTSLPAPQPPSRTMFARVRLVDTGVRPPSKSKSDKFPGRTIQSSSEPVPFNIIVEPLLLGVIPETVVPTILFSIPLLVLAWFAYPYAMRYLEGIASEAREELYGSQLRKTQ